MSRVPLTGGAYQARSLIADAQRCVNLYPEANPHDAAAPVTHYPTPGLRLLATAPNGMGWRGVYRATNGDLYGVAGNAVYYISPTWQCTSLGTIAVGGTPVSMADNGTTVLLVDGTTSGYTITLATRVFAAISSAAFYGADRVDYVDTYFVLNKPGTPAFYISDSNATTFNALNFANKSGFADSLVAPIVMHREVWLIGQLTTEVWFNAGAPDFPFQIMPGAFIEHGCAAKYSIAKYDLSVYWLSQNIEGQCIVLKGNVYQAKRISTHAIEAAIGSYARIDDAIGYCYQQGGHLFYMLIFPTAGKSWCFDETTQLWHERASVGVNGNLHRHRSNCAAFAYGINVVGDYQNGRLYALDQSAYTDNGQPITRIRSFPHMLSDGRRMMYRQFIADMEVGTGAGTLTSAPPQVSLRWSDTKGASWGNPVLGTMGAAGEYLTSMQWQRLGMARDRVFELSWSAPVQTALNGAFVDAKAVAT